MDFIICSALLGFVWHTNKRFRNCWFECILYNNSNKWVKKMEERKLKAVERIKQIAKEGQTIEVELRDKEDSSQLGEVVFVGDDYVEFIRNVKSEIAQEDDDSKIVTAYEVTTIILLGDIRAFSVLKKGTTMRQNTSGGDVNE